MRGALEKTFSVEFSESKDDRASKVKHDRKKKNQRQKDKDADAINIETNYGGSRTNARSAEKRMKQQKKTRVRDAALSRKDQGKKQLQAESEEGLHWKGRSGCKSSWGKKRRPRGPQLGSVGCRPYAEDALAMRLTAIETGQWPTARQECLRVTVSYLRAMSPKQRPASIASINRCIILRRLYRTRCAVLMTPGALASGLIRCLDSSPALCKAFIPFVDAGVGVNDRDEGPDPRLTDNAANVAVQNLRAIGEVSFLNWPPEECANWLCSQSCAALQVEPKLIVEDLIAQGLVSKGDNDRISYNDLKLGQVPAASSKACWRFSDIERSLLSAARESITISLGYGNTSTWSAIMMRDVGLGELALHWRAKTLEKLGGDAPGLSEVRLKIHSTHDMLVVGSQEVKVVKKGVWTGEYVQEDILMEKRGNNCMINVAVFASEESLVTEFLAQLTEIAETDIKCRFTPHHFCVQGLDFYGRCREVWQLERMLGWSFDFVRSEQDGSFTGALIAVQHPDTSKASEIQVRKFISLIFSLEPAFTISNSITAEMHSALYDDEECPWRIIRSIAFFDESPLIVKFRPSSGDPHHYDLLAWLGILSLKPAWGVDGAVERFEEARVEASKVLEERFRGTCGDEWIAELKRLAKARAILAEEHKKSVRDAERRVQEQLASGKKVILSHSYGK